MKTIVKKIASILFLLTISIQGILSHELLIARFDITSTVAGYDLSIRLDRDNIFKTLEQECDLQVSLEEKLTNYIYDHFLLNMDGSDIDYDLWEIHYDEDFITITGQLIAKNPDFQELVVLNTCMIDTIDRHSNIVSVHHQGRRRSFRLDKNRKETTIKY